MEEDGPTSQKHKDLANVIKGTHAELRLKVQMVHRESNSSSEIEKIEDDIWTKHAQDVMSSDEKSYANAMGTLAREIWAGDNDVTVTSQSRIDWIRRHLDKYFYENDHKRFEERMERKLFYLKNEQLQPDVEKEKIYPEFTEKIRVLDVGSCYNPLAKYSSYRVVALDLSPAPENGGVYQCDFVNVKVIDNESEENRADLETDEYLPIARLRYNVCQKAFKVLKNRGLLIIVTPDSSHQGKNLVQIRSWQIALALIGFVRVYVEKLKHLRCLAFVKVDKKYDDVCKSEAKTLSQKLGIVLDENLISDPSSLMFIPQDLTTKKQIEQKELHYNSNQNENQDIHNIVDSEFFSASSEEIDN